KVASKVLPPTIETYGAASGRNGATCESLRMEFIQVHQRKAPGLHPGLMDARGAWLELDTSDERALALTAGTGRRVDGTEAAAVQAGVGARSELHRYARKVPRDRGRR